MPDAFGYLDRVIARGIDAAAVTDVRLSLAPLPWADEPAETPLEVETGEVAAARGPVLEPLQERPTERVRSVPSEATGREPAGPRPPVPLPPDRPPHPGSTIEPASTRRVAAETVPTEPTTTAPESLKRPTSDAAPVEELRPAKRRGAVVSRPPAPPAHHTEGEPPKRRTPPPRAALQVEAPQAPRREPRPVALVEPVAISPPNGDEARSVSVAPSSAPLRTTLPEVSLPRSEMSLALADHPAEVRTAPPAPERTAEVRIGTVEIVLAPDLPRTPRPASAQVVTFDEYDSLRSYR